MLQRSSLGALKKKSRFRFSNHKRGEHFVRVACSKAPFSTSQRMSRLGDEFDTLVNGTGTSLSSDWKGNGCGMIDQPCYALHQEHDD